VSRGALMTPSARPSARFPVGIPRRPAGGPERHQIGTKKIAYRKVADRIGTSTAGRRRAPARSRSAEVRQKVHQLVVRIQGPCSSEVALRKT